MRGCLAEALVIASALAVPDPRERPLGTAAGGGPGAPAVSRRALRFPVARRAVGILRRRAPRRRCRIGALVDACRAQFVSFLRLLEWRDVHRAARSRRSTEAGWQWPRALPATFDAAALRHAAQGGARRIAGQHRRRSRTPTSITPARAACSFYLHPGVGARDARAPKWVLAAELTETTRLFARCAAKIEPEWIEEVAGDAGDARLLRPALGRKARRGRRQRARAAVRADAGARGARCRSAAIDPDVGARSVHPRGARAGRAAHARRVSSRTTAR